MPTKCTERICENIRSILGCERSVKRENHPARVPVALTIAGSDSGGGAGIQADLKTFAALGVHGVTALTCITAQNPRRVLRIEPCQPDMVRSQLLAIFSELPPTAAKTGMLYSPGIIRVVAKSLRGRPLPFVLDPVMISTSGSKLLTRSALHTLGRDLLPLATLLTPNVEEAEVLCGQSISSVEDLRRAAKQLHSRFGTAALVKGGHLRGMLQAVDIFYDGTEELLLRAPFVHGVRTHGTGCTFSAAITAFLAAGVPLAQSVIRAKQFITQAIADSQRAGRHWILNQAGENSASGGLATRLRHRLRR